MTLDKELEEKKLRKAEYEYGYTEGEKHGMERGSLLSSIETAKRMLNLKKFSLEEIADISGLPLEEVLKLQKTES